MLAYLAHTHTRRAPGVRVVGFARVFFSSRGVPSDVAHRHTLFLAGGLLRSETQQRGLLLHPQGRNVPRLEQLADGLTTCLSYGPVCVCSDLRKPWELNLYPATAVVGDSSVCFSCVFLSKGLYLRRFICGSWRNRQ
ncbi:hypothetical protein CSUI_008487 [Cystoisospora suis]|uniref:Uncharacterized protein n=1 Tax=Cystoisospora suis TaxID=483139 RepID=A0A2C6KMR4_9APIC|nr:hypothetical protein CSUI_008487 [Cystoisospora suis]